MCVLHLGRYDDEKDSFALLAQLLSSLAVLTALAEGGKLSGHGPRM